MRHMTVVWRRQPACCRATHLLLQSPPSPAVAWAQVNGSSIRPWWIHHHYWAMVTMAILLTLPVDSRAVQAFVRKFLWWSTFQVRTGIASRSPVMIRVHSSVHMLYVCLFCPAPNFDLAHWTVHPWLLSSCALGSGR